MNLSDHSKSIAQKLAALHKNMKHVTEGHDPFSDWLSSLGLGGWLQNIIKGALMVLTVLLVLVLCVPCFFQCLQGVMSNLIECMFTTNGIWIAQKQEGGDVGGGLEIRTISNNQLAERNVLELVGHKPWEDKQGE